MKLLLEFIEANISKFNDFLMTIIRCNNDANGIIATLSKDRIEVIYDYKYIHDDYQNFDCSEVSSSQFQYHFFTYELNLNESDEKEKTIDNFNFVSKYNNVITLRISMDNLKQLSNMLKDTKLTALQLKAVNYKNYKSKLEEDSSDNSKYKTMLSIKDMNADNMDNTSVDSSLSILIKAVKKPFLLSNRVFSDKIINISYNLKYINCLGKTAAKRDINTIYMDIAVTEEYIKVRFQLENLSRITKLHNIKEDNLACVCPYNRRFAILTDHLLTISEKLNSSRASEFQYLIIYEQYMELRMFYNSFKDSDNTKEKPYMTSSFSIPIKLLDEDQMELD